jgi:hypothetical protein
MTARLSCGHCAYTTFHPNALWLHSVTAHEAIKMVGVQVVGRRSPVE